MYLLLLFIFRSLQPVMQAFNLLKQLHILETAGKDYGMRQTNLSGKKQF